MPIPFRLEISAEDAIRMWGHRGSYGSQVYDIAARQYAASRGRTVVGNVVALRETVDSAVIVKGELSDEGSDG